MKLSDKIRNKLKNIAIGTAIVASIAFPCVAKAERPLNVELESKSISQVYKAKHIYKDPLYKLASAKSKDKVIDAQKNMKLISDITKQMSDIAGIQEGITINWMDYDEDERNEHGEIGFAASQSLIDSSIKMLYANSESASILTKDEIACIVSHEIGHLVGNSVKVHESMNEVSNVEKLLGSNLIAGDNYSVLWIPLEESLADKASVVFAGKAGYDVTQFKSGLEKVMTYQASFQGVTDKYAVVGCYAYASFLDFHPSYGARILQHEEFVKEYQENPEKAYQDVINGINFSVAKVSTENNSIEFYKEIQKRAKENLTKEEYNQVVSSTKGGSKQVAEALLIKELDKSLEHRVELERRASVDFRKMVDGLNEKQLEGVLDGLQKLHHSTDSLAKMYALMTGSEKLASAIDKRVEYGNEIYMDRAGYVVNKLRDYNQESDVTLIPIDFKKYREKSKEVVVETNRNKTLKNNM